NPIVNEPFGNLAGKRLAVMRADQIQHHVKRTDSTRRREAVAVDNEDAANQLYVGESLGEGRLALPMEGAGEAVEEAGASEVECSVRHASDTRAKTKISPDPCERRRRREAVGISAGTHHYEIDDRSLRSGEVRRNCDSVGSDNRPFFSADNDPVV